MITEQTIAPISESKTKRVSIKFLFKNEVEHSYVLNIPSEDMPKLEGFLITAIKNDWMLIPDKEFPGRMCCLKTEEIICFQTTTL